MPLVDEDLLARHDAFVEDGVEERGFFMEVGPERCFAILDRPAGPAVRPPAFVVCHAYADEFVNLRRAERALARTLARLGHPVLTFHRSGYGDSSGSLAEATLDRQLRETRAAMERTELEAGVPCTGLIGARLGALIAGLVAGDGKADQLLLMNPIFRSGPYFADLMRRAQLIQLLDVEAASEGSVKGFLLRLKEQGMIDISGLPLHRHFYEDLASMDLRAGAGGFRGRALVLHATRRSGPPPDVAAFRDALEAAGGSCTVELVPEPPGVSFGQKSYISTSDPTVRTDLQKPLIDRICASAAAWVGAEA
jgi:hypothetical protein